MKSRAMAVLGLTLALMSGVGCNSNKSNDSAPIQQRTARGNGPATYNAQGYYYTAATGRVFVGSQYGNEFTAAVKGLLSASLNVNAVGSISPTDGVRMRGYVEIDSQGRALPGRSSLSLEIRDSFTATMDPSTNQSIPAIYINVPLTGGTAWNGQADLTFGDQFGDIRIVGSYSGGQFSGRIAYNNRTNAISGESAHSSDRMGDFQIDTCGFFRCQ